MKFILHPSSFILGSKLMSSTQPPPIVQPPTVTKAPPTDRKFPCSKCGARLDFDPSCRSLKCPYCGHAEVIEPSSKQVQERDWEEYWQNASGKETTLAGRSSQVACSVCGAVVLLDDKVAADRCPYCGTFLQNQPQSAEGMIAPEGILPFAITESQAGRAFNAWIASRWFAPNQLYQFANLGRLSGIYVPFWTYDSMTFTHYTGMRGDDYQETETYTERDSNGQEVTKTRQVTKTRWWPVSGEVRHFFDDVLVCASRSVDEGLVRAVEPWDLKKLEGFQPQFLSGFQAERYAIGLREGFDQARAIMDAEIRTLCARDIGGDHQQLQSVQTQHSGITFKHLLLPAWLAAYRYRDQTYQILVNGRTGQVSGTRPYSWVKIVAFVLLIVVLVVAAFLIFSGVARGATSASPASTRLVAPVAGARQQTRDIHPPVAARPRGERLNVLFDSSGTHPGAPIPWKEPSG
jgi:DNA-directed RNA polymerase subunit RPC12/RpoP